MDVVNQVGGDLEVEALAIAVRQLAETKGLAIIPAVPQFSRESLLVFLDQDELSAEAFCDLAVTAGARLLYIEGEAFDADSDPGLREPERRIRLADPPAEGSDRYEPLRGEAEIFNGRIGELQLGFAVGGVMHYWTATASWYNDVMNRATAISDSLETPDYEQMPEGEARALTERLARELADLPEFRYAPSAAQRRRVARALPEIAAVLDENVIQRDYRRHMAVADAISEAARQVIADAEQSFGEIETRLPELAEELTAAERFRSSGSARARREIAKDFLAEKSGGFTVPGRLLELFLDTPPIRKNR